MRAGEAEGGGEKRRKGEGDGRWGKDGGREEGKWGERREGEERREKETHVVRAYGVDLLDLVAERHRLVDDELQELVRRGLAREQFELLIDGPTPEEHDAEGELQR